MLNRQNLNKKRQIERLRRKEKKLRRQRDNLPKQDKEAKMKLKSVNWKPLQNVNEKKQKPPLLKNLDWSKKPPKKKDKG